jgi:hypothetical protein
MSRAKATQHLAERQKVCDTAIAAWGVANRRFAQLCLAQGDDAIREQYRFQAICAYEAMLDAVTCERTALTMLHAAGTGKPGRPKDNA